LARVAGNFRVGTIADLRRSLAAGDRDSPGGGPGER
jgi:hypothetical protein